MVKNARLMDTYYKDVLLKGKWKCPYCGGLNVDSSYEWSGAEIRGCCSCGDCKGTWRVNAVIFSVHGERDGDMFRGHNVLHEDQVRI